MAEGLELEGAFGQKFEPAGGSGAPIQRMRLPCLLGALTLQTGRFGL